MWGWFVIMLSVIQATPWRPGLLLTSRIWGYNTEQCCSIFLKTQFYWYIYRERPYCSWYRDESHSMLLFVYTACDKIMAESYFPFKSNVTIDGSAALLTASVGLYVSEFVLLSALCHLSFHAPGNNVPPRESSHHSMAVTLGHGPDDAHWGKILCESRRLSTCAHEPWGSRAVFKVTSWGSRNL